MIFMDWLGILDRKTAFVMLDIQEKLVSAVQNPEKVISNSNILLQAADAMHIPVIVTEQYPKGLGPTTDKIKLPKKCRKIEKATFSCFNDANFRKKIKDMKVRSLVLFGVEAHVCILETALDALKKKMEVHVVADAVSSRTEENKSLAIERMRQSGVFIVSTEMILFQLLEKAGTRQFKEIQSLIK